MIQRKLRSKLLHDRKLKFVLTAVLLTVAILPGIGSSLTLQLPEIHIVKGRTAAGHPYMNGGFNYDEQRAMEQAAQPFNLKLLFANSVGTPAVPAFLVLGANDGSPIEKISLYGPWLYIQLPPGSYTILARFARHTVLVRDVHLREGLQRTYVLRGDRRRIDARLVNP